MSQYHVLHFQREYHIAVAVQMLNYSVILVRKLVEIFLYSAK